MALTAIIVGDQKTFVTGLKTVQIPFNAVL